MSEGDLFLEFVRPLDALGIRYMLTGSVAATMYGEPRVTHDVDIVVELPTRLVKPFAAAFPLERYYCPPDEVILQEALRRQRGSFRIIAHASAFKADIYLANADPLHLAALDDRRKVVVDGEPIWVAPPEYVIVRKLEFFREGGSEKHLLDIAAMLRISGELIDRVRLEAWIARLGLGPQWSQALSRAEREA